MPKYTPRTYILPQLGQSLAGLRAKCYVLYGCTLFSANAPNLQCFFLQVSSSVQVYIGGGRKGVILSSDPNNKYLTPNTKYRSSVYSLNCPTSYPHTFEKYSKKYNRDILLEIHVRNTLRNIVEGGGCHPFILANLFFASLLCIHMTLHWKKRKLTLGNVQTEQSSIYRFIYTKEIQITL